MLFEDDFSIDGVSALSMGIVMQSNFKFSGAEPDVEVIQVPGRNGALHRYTGAYLNTTAEVECYILQEGAAQNQATLNRFLKGLGGYRRLEVFSDPGYYRRARIQAMPDSDVRLELMAPFTLRWSCMPQHFLVVGDEEVTVTSGETINNPTNEVAHPTITLTGTDMTSLEVGGTLINLNDTTGTIVIDSFRKRVYNQVGTVVSPSTLLRGLQFPTLEPGDNGIRIIADSVTCKIVPHWYEV